MTNIIVNLQWEGVHQWSACPIEEVKYLRDPHRHMFHICCKRAVTHDDRQIEIIQLKHRISEWLDTLYQDHDMGETSCEMLAKKIAQRFGLNYCSVLEDGENGAEYMP